MKLTAVFLAAAVVLGAGGAAQAMPAAPLGTANTGIMLVRDGCGFGAHQGRYGGCRLNRGPRGAIRGMMGRAPRGCPPGTHPTGRGFCRSNRY